MTGYVVFDGPVDEQGYEFPSRQIVKISVDINFNGSIEENEIEEIYVSRPNQGVSFSFQFHDDGPSPGNTTPQDVATLRVEFVQDVQLKAVTVKNIAPEIVGMPSVTFGTNSTGWYVDVGVLSVDPEILDNHKLTVVFGDDSTAKTTFIGGSEGCLGKGISLRHYYGEGFILYPIRVSIEDDDSGLTTRTITKLGVAVNDNDSNSNSVVDLIDSGFNDPDLKQISGLLVSPMNTDVNRGTSYLSYNYPQIKIWNSQSKNSLIAPYGVTSEEASIPYTGQSQMWVEATAVGLSDIFVTWVPNSSNDNMHGHCNSSITGNVIRVTNSFIDLDVDSDNDEGLSLNFEHDAWNDYIEDNEYAIGKMLFTYNTVANPAGWAPMTLQLSGDMGPDKVLAFFWKQRGTSTGSVDIWKKAKEDPTRTNADKVVWQTVDQTEYFPVSQFNIESGLVRLWLAPTIALPPSDFRKVDSPKPDDLVTAKMKDLSTGEIWDDTIKYMIIQAGYNPDQSFYTALQPMPQLRSAGASDAVYGNGGANDLPFDNKKFTLKMLTESDLRLLFDDDRYLREHPDDYAFLLNILTSTALSPPGVPTTDALKVRLYLDHSDTESGNYILSYRGTDFSTSDDWIANIQNLLSGQSVMHYLATLVGQKMGYSNIPFTVTGHSLGGGLAASAALESGHHAFTFNAAAINPLLYTDTTRPGHMNFPTAALNYLTERNRLIDTYSVWYVRPLKGGAVTGSTTIVSDCPDILTTLQFAFSGSPGIVNTFLPDGVFHPIEGLYDLTKQEYTGMMLMLHVINEFRKGNLSEVALAAELASIYLSTGIGDVIAKTANSHKFGSIYFGLLHIPDGWNAYDRNSHPGY